MMREGIAFWMSRMRQKITCSDLFFTSVPCVSCRKSWDNRINTYHVDADIISWTVSPDKGTLQLYVENYIEVRCMTVSTDIFFH